MRVQKEEKLTKKVNNFNEQNTLVKVKENQETSQKV